MSEQSSWAEIGQASEEGRHELHLNGDTVSDRLELSDGILPKKLFQLKMLNYLEISDTTLTELPAEIGNLKSLLHLALHRNSISILPESINKLDILKFFDLSYNKLISFPEPVNMVTLHTLNLGNNVLECLPDFSKLIGLSILFIDHNKLTELPTGLENILELHAASNQISSLPQDMFPNMHSLKLLDLSENNLKDIPGDLSAFRKLKDLNLKNNPLKDNRLKKLTVQCSTKAILDYIAKHNDSGGGGGSKKRGKGKKGKAEKIESTEDERKIFVVQIKENEKKVFSMASVKDTRPYICCTVIKQLDLSDAAMFKSFISLQTKLHENECSMRTKATIATHNLNDLKFPLKYEALPCADIAIVALGKEKKSSAEALVASLKAERDSLKLKKKRQPKTGLYKFIELVDGKELYACLKNIEGEVISFPPITNSEHTKVTSTVCDVFIEVTSPVSLPQCKYVMEELIKEMFQLEFQSNVDDRNGLVLEQIRVLDENEDLRVIYPSKVDLDFNRISVERIER